MQHYRCLAGMFFFMVLSCKPWVSFLHCIWKCGVDKKFICIFYIARLLEKTYHEFWTVYLTHYTHFQLAIHKIMFIEVFKVFLNFNTFYTLLPCPVLLYLLLIFHSCSLLTGVSSLFLLVVLLFNKLTSGLYVFVFRKIVSKRCNRLPFFPVASTKSEKEAIKLEIFCSVYLILLLLCS